MKKPILYGGIIKLGRQYKVTIEDCCVSGEFTSVLVGVEIDNDGSKQPQIYSDVKNPDHSIHTDNISEVTFQNKVKLFSLIGVQFEEVK